MSAGAQVAVVAAGAGAGAAALVVAFRAYDHPMMELLLAGLAYCF